MSYRLLLRPIVPIQTSILDRFGEMLRAYVWGIAKIGDGTRDFEDPVMRPRRKTHPADGHLERALNNGVTPEEIGELITHLAFYGGWPVAMSGALVAKDVLAQHKR